METTPSPEEMRAELARLDAMQQKIAGALMPVLFQHPGRLKEREWLAEQFASVALLALELYQEVEGSEGLAQVQIYARENLDTVMNACFRLFLRVGEDMKDLAGDGFTLQEATLQALGYMRL